MQSGLNIVGDQKNAVRRCSNIIDLINKRPTSVVAGVANPY